MAPKKIAERAAAILKILNSLYPQVKPQLFYRNPFELLVATILSAQCTDSQVNRVTPGLFKRMRKPQEFVKTPCHRNREARPADRLLPEQGPEYQGLL